MFLFELEDPEVVRFATSVSQLKNQIDNGKVDINNYTKDDLLDYFAKNDINLDISDIYDMMKNAPLNKLVKNIQGDKVIFVGQSDDTTGDPTQNQQVVQQMAKDAMPKK